MATNVIQDFKKELKLIEKEELLNLQFLFRNFSKMPHQQLKSDRIDQKALDADLIRWLIQRELDSRALSELPYSIAEVYLALGIPKEFLR